MGNTQSSSIAIEEITHPYIRTPRLTRQYYLEHSSGESVNPEISKDHEPLYQIPPELLGKVSLHRSLDLSFNFIEEIPTELPLHLPHLTVLNLSHNRISFIPESVFGFIHLRLLDLSYNNITSIPSTICLIHELRKVDLSHNKIFKIASSINNLKRLEKLNVSHNQIEHLPISLGNIPTLQVLLADNNPLQMELEQMDSKKLLEYLRTCYSGSVASLPADHISLGNPWTRVRGQVFDSSVLNAGSDQSLFDQLQSQAVNTGNKLQTPLIPPPKSTTLKVDKLKDTLLGLLYGAAIGDSLGFLTENMSPDEAAFHFSRKTVDQSHLFKDEYRCEASPGMVSPCMHLVLQLLDSIMKWAGVVDELDFAQRLVSWYENNPQYIRSEVIHQLMTDKETFLKVPKAAAKNLSEKLTIVDEMCLPAMLAIAVTQFHNLHEVDQNAKRICSSTHCSVTLIEASSKLALLMSQILQGKSVGNIPEFTRSSATTAQCERLLMEELDTFQQHGFREALLNIMMTGGNSTVNCCVAGAIFGGLTGYQNLPSNWLQLISRSFISSMDKKVNLLLDLMGLP